MCEDGSHLIPVDLKSILLGSFDFMFDGIRCKNMLVLLLAFQFKDEKQQAFILEMKGKSNLKQITQLGLEWKKNQILYWKGRAYKRNSEKYQILINRAFNSLSLNEGFQNVLLNVERNSLSFLNESGDIKTTVLTKKELSYFLLKIQKNLLIIHEQLNSMSDYNQSLMN